MSYETEELENYYNQLSTEEQTYPKKAAITLYTEDIGSREEVLKEITAVLKAFK